MKPRWILSPPTPAQSGLRIFVFFSLALALTAGAAELFADLLWRTGWSALRTAAMVLFVPLFLFSAVGFMNAAFGFVLRRFDPPEETAPEPPGENLDPGASAAVVFPVCNEEIHRVCEGLRATYESIQRTGQLERFDFFILSDTTAPERWIAEERAWRELTHELGALGRIYYRRRVDNEGRKCGNIRDFLNAWGRRYRYFLILDADSVMTGGAIIELAALMEANPAVGLIQTVPAVVNAETLFGRMQQFANRFYTPIFVRGLNFWSRGSSNYWGHNAIIRVEAFMAHCALPTLPGRKPFGGQILSHDFVEAALLLKANWQVWLAEGLPGSYEEAPQNMLDNARRDRRWCQGNLQHSMVLFARGLRGASRIHLLQGIFGYLASPLWLAFLVVFYWMWVYSRMTGLSTIAVHSWLARLNLTATGQALLVFSISMGVLLTPRLLAICDALLDSRRRRAFGGGPPLIASVVAETLFSTLHAPLQMLWHSEFVIGILSGHAVSWGGQDRGAGGVTWRDAARRQGWQTALGLAGGALVWRSAHEMFWWFAPLLCGMVLAIPLCAWTSRESWGRAARRWGLFLTPEETAPPRELAALRARMAAAGAAPAIATAPILDECVVDPYLNAIHVSLLREISLHPEAAAALQKMGVGSPGARTLGEKLLRVGFAALPPAERQLILSDANTMSWLHRQVWRRPETQVAPAWRAAILAYDLQN